MVFTMIIDELKKITKARLKMEFDAYMQEIHWADSIGRKDIANQLFENYLVERQHITNHLK